MMIRVCSSNKLWTEIFFTQVFYDKMCEAQQEIRSIAASSTAEATSEKQRSSYSEKPKVQYPGQY